MKITFWGATKTVTGSKHLIETEGFKILLDCGMFQGARTITNQLNSKLPFNPSEVNAMILSHAHLDHCGMIPTLVRDGFKGKIYATPATIDISKYIMQDSAMLQQNDAEYFNAHQNQNPIYPLYTMEDVAKTFDYFEPVLYFRHTNHWTQINENIRFKFYDAGHILGSAVIVLEIKEKGETKTVAFTGDLGRKNMPILQDPEFIEEKIDTLISECTYGGRLHRSLEDVTEELEHIIDLAIINKGKIIVPAFALGRMQELTYIIHQLIDKEAIHSIPIYVDSPLGENITAVFARYTDDFDQEFWKDFGNKKEAPFDFNNLHRAISAEESKALNQKEGPFMIIAASGMCEGGRVLHHLKNGITDKDNIVLITGYQAENTLGRKILEGESPVKIYGEEYPVKANVFVLNELSAHGDQNDLFIYMSKAKGLKNLFLVHGELSQSEAFLKIVKEYNVTLPVEIPEIGQSFEV